MNKRLISIVLMCVYLISPVTYAADVSAPAYLVDVTHSVATVDVNGPVAMTEAKTTQFKNTNKITTLNGLHEPRRSTLIVACGYDSVKNANVLGVSGGDSIGIGRPI